MLITKDVNIATNDGKAYGLRRPRNLTLLERRMLSGFGGTTRYLVESWKDGERSRY